MLKAAAQIISVTDVMFFSVCQKLSDGPRYPVSRVRFYYQNKIIVVQMNSHLFSLLLTPKFY